MIRVGIVRGGLVQAGEGGGDAAHCFFNVVVAGGVAEAYVAVETEGGAVNGRYAGLLEQVHGQVA